MLIGTQAISWKNWWLVQNTCATGSLSFWFVCVSSEEPFWFIFTDYQMKCCSSLFSRKLLALVRWEGCLLTCCFLSFLSFIIFHSATWLVVLVFWDVPPTDPLLSIWHFLTFCDTLSVFYMLGTVLLPYCLLLLIVLTEKFSKTRIITLFSLKLNPTKYKMINRNITESEPAVV